jgi:hypothetical protein
MLARLGAVAVLRYGNRYLEISAGTRPSAIRAEGSRGAAYWGRVKRLCVVTDVSDRPLRAYRKSHQLISCFS